MYIESVPNRHSPPAILLRESYREAGKVRKRTLANLSKWPPVVVEGLRILLKLVFDSEEFKLIVKQWVSGHTKSLGTTYRRSSQFE